MTNMELSCVFHFASSHFLTKYHGKCENLHGHNYKLIITIEGAIKEDGMVMDFKLIRNAVNDHIIEHLDHKHLNDIIENPSAENTAIWIWEHLHKHLPLKKITIYETDDYFCDYYGK